MTDDKDDDRVTLGDVFSDADIAAMNEIAGARAEEKPEPEPNPEPAPTPEPEKPQPAAEKPALQPEPERREAMVPLAALHQTREELKAIKAKLAEYEARNKPAEPAKPQPPDPARDPLGAITYERAQRERIEQQLAAYEQSIAQRADEDRVVDAYRRDAARFASEAPDFAEAYTHAIKGIQGIAETMGLENPEIEVRNFEANLVRNAIARGQSPAEAVYGLARRFGYVPPANEPEPEPEPAKAAKPAPKQVEAAAARHKSIAGPGRAAGGPISLEDVAKMPTDEFAALMSDPAVRAEYERRLSGQL